MAEPSKKNKRREVNRGRHARTQVSFLDYARSLEANVLFRVLVIAVAGVLVYWPALDGDWLWDDDLLITNNPVVQNPAGLWEIWFAPAALVDYQPIEVTVVWLEWQLWSGQVFGYHLVNLVLHLVSALLIWRLLDKLGLRLAWLGGLIFAVHPLMVESVAWMAELKNTLSLPPFLLAMCAWIDFEERRERRDYFLALGFFLAAMLCKPTMVMFPVVTLLFAWWKRGRIGLVDIKASAPFFVVSLTLGLVTIWFLHHHAMTGTAIDLGGPLARLALCGLSLSFYFAKCVLPVGLLPVYPQWEVNPPSALQFLPWPVLLGIFSLLWWKRVEWGRGPLLGLGFFLIMLAPFLGLTAGSYMAFTWVMDHVLYIPIIGLIGLALAVMERMGALLPDSTRPVALGALVMVLALMTWQSRGYASLYLNQETLWSYAIEHNPQAWIAYHNLGEAYQKESRLEDAAEQYEHALRLKPDYANSHNSLGNVLLQMGRVDEAIGHFRQAMTTSPNQAVAHNDLGNAFFQENRLPEAQTEYEAAVRIDPQFAKARNNLGNVLARSGHLPEAIEEYRQAVQINPGYADAYYDWGNVLAQSGKFPEAMERYAQALKIKPGHIEAHNNLAAALCHEGRLAEAMEQYQQILQINPQYAPAQTMLAKIQAALQKR